MGNESSAPVNNVVQYENPRPRGEIDIGISTFSHARDSTVRARGYRTSVVDDDDLKLFKITPNKLKDAIEEYEGERPTSVYVKSPTRPWRDLYARNENWYPVEKTVKAVSAEVIGVDYTDVKFVAKRYTNNTDETAIFKSKFSESVTNTVSTTWSSELSCNAGINYKLKFPGSVNLGFTAKCGVEVNRSKSTTICIEDSVEVPLRPGKSVIAHLTSRKKTVFVQVEYEISLKGDVACYYEDGYENHRFWAFDVNNILEEVDKPTVVEANEVLKIDYYSDGDIELRNVNSSRSSTDRYCRAHGVRDYNIY